MRKQYANQLQAAENAAALALENKKTLLFTVFLFLTGISAGVFLELTMMPEEKHGVLSDLLQYLSPDRAAVFPSPFFASVSNNLLLLFLSFLAGISVFGFPAALLILLYKGIGLGFSAGLILESQRENGAFLILSSLVPQNLFLIPVFILAASGVLNYGLSRLRSQNPAIKRSRMVSPGSLVILMLMLALLAVMGCGIEAILYPVVLSP